MKRIYLSGGTVSGWQEYLINTLQSTLPRDSAEFYNPSAFKLGSLDRPELRIFGPMDKLKIEECDILFGYLEATNPTPINVALEMGYAKGLGKLVILCNEWTPERFEAKSLRCLEPEGKATWFRPHYVDLMNSWADFCEQDFGLSIELLRRVIGYNN